MVRRGTGRVVRLLGVVVAVAVAMVAGWGGWLLWSYPPPYSVSLPAGVEEGEVRAFNEAADAIGVYRSSDDAPISMRFKGLRLENRHWVGEVSLAQDADNVRAVSLRLGQSVYVDGVGTLTLISVDPKVEPPWRRSMKGRGRELVLNLNLDPGVTLGPTPRMAQGSPVPDAEQYPG